MPGVDVVGLGRKICKNTGQTVSSQTLLAPAISVASRQGFRVA